MSGQIFRRETEVFISRELSPEARARHLASVAKAGLREILGSRASPLYNKFVDGVPDKSEDLVKAEGVIRYEFSILPSVLGFLIGYLRNRSPVRRGRFRDSFFVAINGKMIMASDINPKHLPMTAEIFIGNIQPYNRRVDVQLDGNKRLSFSVPPNLYRDAINAADRRFGAMLDIFRIYTVEFPGQYILKYGPRAGKRVHSPAIHIKPRI